MFNDSHKDLLLELHKDSINYITLSISRDHYVALIDRKD